MTAGSLCPCPDLLFGVEGCHDPSHTPRSSGDAAADGADRGQLHTTVCDQRRRRNVNSGGLASVDRGAASLGPADSGTMGSSALAPLSTCWPSARAAALACHRDSGLGEPPRLFRAAHDHSRLSP